MYMRIKQNKCIRWWGGVLARGRAVVGLLLYQLPGVAILQVWATLRSSPAVTDTHCHCHCITTHHPLSHHPPHHLLSHHLLYSPHTHTLYSQPLKKTSADCQNVWFNSISWLLNCTELKPYNFYTMVSRLLVPIAIWSLHSITRHVINERHSSSLRIQNSNCVSTLRTNFELRDTCNSNFEYEITNYDAHLSRATWSSADFKSQSVQVTSKPLYVAACFVFTLLGLIHKWLGIP